MAGRRAHIEANDFKDFLDSIPEDAKGTGFWRVKKESRGGQGGVVHSYLGFTQFQAGEAYSDLRTRIKEEFCPRGGPGTYYLIPCNSRKSELKDTDQVKLTYSYEEVPMPAPETAAPKEQSPLKEALEGVKKVHRDVSEVKALELQEKLMNRLLGGSKKDDDDEEDDVKASEAMGGGLQDMLLYKMMLGDDNKKPDANVQERLLDAKIDNKFNEIKSMLQAQKPAVDPVLEKVLDRLSQPKDDDKFDKLMAQMMEKEKSEKSENAFQAMMAMMMQQQQARDKEREAEERRREEERREERRRLEDERKLERERMDREERQRAEDRKVELARIEAERKEDREKYLKELEERQKRFDSELALRREELKSEGAKAREYSVEQQKMQHQLFAIFKENKDSSLDITSKIVDTLTGAGLASMKTAQQAAESIMSIAKRVDKDDEDKEEKGGLGGILKDLGGIAAPLLAPYADADAKMKMLQSLGQVAGAGGLEALMGAAAGGRPAAPRKEAGMSGLSPGAPKASKTDGGMPMIAKYLQSFPILKDALIGNLADGLGVDLYLPIILGLDQPTLEGLIANVPPQVVMTEVKRVCLPAEQQLVDRNPQWFAELRQAMIDELKGEDEEEEIPAPAPAGPAAQAPTPAPK